MVMIGPVQMLTVGFGPDTKFEGRILGELENLERSGHLRVLDILFVRKETSGDTVALDYQAEGMGDTISALLGLGPGALGDDAEGAEPYSPEEKAFGLTPDDIRALAESLFPGTAAGFVLLEHVWARSLRDAIREVGGVPLAEGFLTPETLGPVAVQLAATAQVLDELTAAEDAADRMSGRLQRRTS